MAVHLQSQIKPDCNFKGKYLRIAYVMDTLRLRSLELQGIYVCPLCPPSSPVPGIHRQQCTCESHTTLLVSLAMREGLACLIGPEFGDPLTFPMIPQYR
jgi:hypothetical protein